MKHSEDLDASLNRSTSSRFCHSRSAFPILVENFDNVGGLPGAGWSLLNNSVPIGSTGWFQGNPGIFPAQSGAVDNSYAAANFNNAAAGGNISNWLITPLMTIVDGSTISFYTRSTSVFEDRLEVRLNTSGTTNIGATDASIGDFSTALLTINPTLSGTYPTTWTQFSITISGVPVPTSSRIAFRYFVPNTDMNGDYIGIDTLVVDDIPEPATTVLVGRGISALALFRYYARRQ